jgi:hypothetical protein
LQNRKQVLPLYHCNGAGFNNKKKMRTQNLGQRIVNLLSKVGSMSDSKNSSTKRSQAAYLIQREECSKEIAALRSLGVNETKFPYFNDAVVKFNYWK